MDREAFTDPASHASPKICGCDLLCATNRHALDGSGVEIVSHGCVPSKRMSPLVLIMSLGDRCRVRYSSIRSFEGCAVTCFRVAFEKPRCYIYMLVV